MRNGLVDTVPFVSFVQAFVIGDNARLVVAHSVNGAPTTPC